MQFIDSCRQGMILARYRLLDIHDTAPRMKMGITKVGAESIRLILKTKRKTGINVLYPSVNLYVNLPINMKGVHISRSLETLNEVLDTFKNKPIRYLENFCLKIAKALLRRHEYSTISEVFLKSSYYIARRSPATNNISDEYCSVYASALAEKHNNVLKVRRFIGAEIVGLTYCPCLMQEIRSYAINQLEAGFKVQTKEAQKMVASVPLASHNQRCKVYALVETSNKMHIDVDDLIEILESSTSAPTFSLIKRDDEVQLIKQAANKPMFVEDVLREVSYKLMQRFPHLPEDFTVHIRVESEESIHKHNLISENRTSVGELKKDLAA